MSCWYLEHLLTGKRVDLPNGKITIGRNSACSIVLNYDYMSRQHVEITVSPDKVSVKCLNAVNGVFVNGEDIKKKLNGVPVREGDSIGLGCPVPEKVTKTSPVFRLKNGPATTEEIVLSSDSDDDSTPLPPLKSVAEIKAETEIKLSEQIPNVANDNAASTSADKQTGEGSPTTACLHTILHLPKVPQVKQEWVQTAKDIANIFGEADECIIGSVLEINPYLYNHLLKEKQAVPISKLHDGQFIDLDENENKPEDPPCPEQPDNADSSMLPPCPPPPSLGGCDEHMAMSQAVLQEMKEEMAFSDGKTNNNGSPLSSTDDGDIIVITDSDDEDLHSQKAPDVLSQTCPIHKADSISSLKRSKPVRSDLSSTTDDCQLFTRRQRRTQFSPCLRLNEFCGSLNDLDFENRSRFKALNDESSNEANRISVEKSNDKVVPGLSKKSKIVKPREEIDLDISIAIELLANSIETPSMEEAEPMEYSSMEKADTSGEVRKETPSVNNRSKENKPPRREPNTRLRSRAISCYYERPQDEPNLAARILNGMDMRRIRGPEVIEAPSLPKYRSKLRGVSAVLKDDNNNNGPYKKMPRAKDMVDNETESLGKLTEKKPAECTSGQSGRRKRKATTTVPRVRNSNRGAFLTEGINGPNMDLIKRNRRATIDAETFIQQVQARRNGRPPERKEAEIARNRRTCNRTTFASMEKDMEEKLRFQNMFKKKDTELLFCSTYAERREQWSRNQVNDSTSYVKTILKWANQWLKLRSVDAVVDSDVLKPIVHEFETVKQYKESFMPLMKLDLLTTIERDYKLRRRPYEVSLPYPVEETKSFYFLTARVFTKPTEKYMLYTLSSGKKLKKTFAILQGQRTENDHELIFKILKDGISLDTFKGITLLTARPVVDSLELELGALQAVDQLSHSPLHRRILKPTEILKNAHIPSNGTPCVFKGFAKLNPQQEAICSSTYQRVIDDASPSITLIQGPTDTGKSMLIANISMQCLYGRAVIQKDRKILICSHSNTAVDSIVLRLHNVREKYNEKNRFHMLRYGLYEEMTPLSRQYSLEHKYQSANSHKRKRLSPEKRATLQQKYNDLEVEVNLMKKKNHDGPCVYQKKVEQLQALEEKLNPRLTHPEELDIAKSHIEAANIVCTTLSSCTELGSFINYFDICLIDEATQCTEPWTLLPMRFGILHLVLVGDTQQLPTGVLSHKAADFGLAKSMFDRIQRSLKKQQGVQPDGHLSVDTKLFTLTTQYRMHPEDC